MSRLLWYSLLRHLIRNPWQLASSLLGIALGVAVVLAVDLANTNAISSFQLAADQLSGDATHRIMAIKNDVPEELYIKLKQDLSISHLIPIVTGEIVLNSAANKKFQLLGFDPFSALSIDSAEATESRLKIFTDKDLDWINLLIEPNSVILPPDATFAHHTLLLADEKSVTLKAVGQSSGILSYGLILTDISTAQVLLDMPGKLSYINVFISENSKDQDITKIIEQQLPTGFTLERITEINQSINELSSSFRLNLTAMSLLALLIGTFLIHNTMTFAVVQRRELLGILRALGVSRNEVAIVILGEALILGFVGTLLGCLLGIWLGSGLVQLVTRTVDDLYHPLYRVFYTTIYFSVLKVSIFGLLVTLLAAWLPAREASRVPPGAAMTRANLESRWRLHLPRLNLTGITVIVLGTSVLWFSKELIAGFIALFLIILGTALLTPWLLVQLVRVSQWLTAETVTTMALRGISRHLSRTGIAVTALAVAFSATVGVTIMVDSFRTGVVDWLQQQLTADLYISSASSTSRSQPLLPEVIARLRSMPEISAISTYRWLDIRLQGKPTRLVAVDLAPATQNDYRLLSGNPVTVWKNFQSNGAVIISEPIAYHRQLKTGDKLTLTTLSGPKNFSVVGIFHDYSSEHGRILISRDTYSQLWQDDSVTSAAIYLSNEQNLDQLKNQIEQKLASLQSLKIRSNRNIFEASLIVFDQTFAITNILQLLAVFIAFVGILSALMALQLERSREFAILRTIGMTMGQITRLIFLQTGFMGFFAGLIAIPMGLILAVLLIFVINRRAFGWSLPFQINFEVFYQCIGLAVAGALLASIYPLWKQNRLNLAQALRSE